MPSLIAVFRILCYILFIQDSSASAKLTTLPSQTLYMKLAELTGVTQLLTYTTLEDKEEKMSVEITYTEVNFQRDGKKKMDCNSTGKINASTKKTWSFSRSALLQITVLCILLVIIIVLFILVIQKTADTMNKSKTNYQGLCNINGTSDDCIHDLNYQLQECKSDMNKAQQDCKINGCDGHDILKDHLKKTCRKEWSTGEMNCSFCPTGWLQNFRKCYFISKENKTWLECRNICISHKADLVIVKEKNELEYLQYIMNDANGFYWIGLRRDSSEIWRWVDGSPFDGSLFQNVTRHGGTHVFISKKTTSSGLHYTKKMCICQRSSVMV